MSVAVECIQEPLRLGTESKLAKDATATDNDRKASTDSANVSHFAYMCLS